MTSKIEELWAFAESEVEKLGLNKELLAITFSGYMRMKPGSMLRLNFFYESYFIEALDLDSNGNEINSLDFEESFKEELESLVGLDTAYSEIKEAYEAIIPGVEVKATASDFNILYEVFVEGICASRLWFDRENWCHHDNLSEKAKRDLKPFLK